MEKGEYSKGKYILTGYILKKIKIALNFIIDT